MIMLVFGIVLLVIGGIVAFCLLMALIGAIFGLLIFALKVAVPVILVYLGYRLITRDRHQVTY